MTNSSVSSCNMFSSSKCIEKQTVKVSTQGDTNQFYQLKNRIDDQQLQPLLTKTASMRRTFSWWLLVALYTFFLLFGQTAGTLLQRFYYNQGGNSKWIQTLVFSAGFPVLYLPLLLTPSTTPSMEEPKLSLIKISVIYSAIGLITTADSLMYSHGLLYLTASTYALVSTTQLAFNAIFSFFINKEKFTHLTFNSIILLTFAASILAVHPDQLPVPSSNISSGKYMLGFTLTLAASALFSFILSMMELTFQKVTKRQTFKAVLEMQLYTAFVSTVGALVGLYASKEWKGLKEEMEGFGKGKVGYVMTLVWASIAWQVTNVGLVGLIFKVSSLFSNVISALGTPLVPLFAVWLYHDSMDGLKIISFLLGLWGFASYFYQHYIDYLAEKKGVQKDGSYMPNQMPLV